MNISAGIQREALRDLTGASAKTFFLNNKMSDSQKRETWIRMSKATDRKFIMGTSSGDVGR